MEQEHEFIRLRREVEALRADLLLVSARMERVAALGETVAVLKATVGSISNGGHGRLDKMEGDVKINTRFVAVCVGGLSILGPLTFWLLSQFQIVHK